jgi:Fuc2NAc and GlcNAc transferase
VLVTSYLLTRAMLQFGVRFHFIDAPNERSSHTKPKPRCGGVAIVVSSLSAIALGAIVGRLDPNVSQALLISGGLVASAGLWDDHRSSSPLIRLAVHILAACVLLLLLGSPPIDDASPFQMGTRYAAFLFGVVGVTWLINLTNFMDGIDGLAAAECVFVMTFGGGLLYSRGNSALAEMCFAVSAAAMGFLVMNWSPAKIFMGDVGSTYIGLACAALTLADMMTEPARIWPWLILLAVFLTDSAVTLLRRFFSGMSVSVPHRTHAYQHAAARWGHARTTVMLTAINIFWLGPLAVCASKWPRFGAGLFALAVCPLAIAVWDIGAGIIVPMASTSRHSSKAPIL